MAFDLYASHLPKEDRAEQEDGIEKHETQTQPTVQSPVVQMNTQHLQADAEHADMLIRDRIAKGPFILNKIVFNVSTFLV